jgi:hypothetical protein
VPDGRCARKEQPAWDGMGWHGREGAPGIIALSSQLERRNTQRYPGGSFFTTQLCGVGTHYLYLCTLTIGWPPLVTRSFCRSVFVPHCLRAAIEDLHRPSPDHCFLFSLTSPSSGLSPRSLVTQKPDAPFFQDNAAQKYDPPPSGGKTSGAKTKSGCLDDFLATVEGRHRRDLACRIYRSSCFCTSSHH